MLESLKPSASKAASCLRKHELVGLGPYCIVSFFFVTVLSNPAVYFSSVIQFPYSLIFVVFHKDIVKSELKEISKFSFSYKSYLRRVMFKVPNDFVV